MLYNLFLEICCKPLSEWMNRKEAHNGCAVSLRLYADDGLPFYALRSLGCASQCTCILSFYPSPVFWTSAKGTIHPLPSGEAERWIVAYGLMQSAKNMYHQFRGGGGSGSKAHTAWRFHHFHSANNAGECVLHSWLLTKGEIKILLEWNRHGASCFTSYSL